MLEAIALWNTHINDINDMNLVPLRFGSLNEKVHQFTPLVRQ